MDRSRHPSSQWHSDDMTLSRGCRSASCPRSMEHGPLSRISSANSPDQDADLPISPPRLIILHPGGWTTNTDAATSPMRTSRHQSFPMLLAIISLAPRVAPGHHVSAGCPTSRSPTVPLVSPGNTRPPHRCSIFVGTLPAQPPSTRKTTASLASSILTFPLAIDDDPSSRILGLDPLQAEHDWRLPWSTMPDSSLTSSRCARHDANQELLEDEARLSAASAASRRLAFA